MMKKYRFPIFALLLALLLSACGAKVHTELKLDSATSGSRIIKIVIPKFDEETAAKVNGGIPAIDASIKKHLPQELSFSGLTADGDTHVGTFTLDFDSPQTYQKKLKALLAKDDPNDIEANISLPNSLITGVYVQENFSSIQLLKWAVNGLVEDGVIDKSDSSQALTQGDQQVTVNGQSYPVSTAMIRLAEVQGEGVTHLRIEVTEQESDFAVKAELGYEKGEKFPEEQLKAYLEKSVPQNAKVTATADDFNGFVVSYTAEKLADVAKSLQTLLGDQSFNISTELGSDSAAGFPQRNIVVDFNCVGVCAKEDYRKRFKFIPHGAWEIQGRDELRDSGKISLKMPIRFAQLEINSTLGLDGGTVVFTAVASKEVAEAAGDSIKSLLNPEQAGELSTAEKDGKVHYTVTISEDSQKKLNDALAKISQGTHYQITPDKKAGTFSEGVRFKYFNDFGKVFTVEKGADIRHELAIDGYTIQKSSEGNEATITKTLSAGEIFIVSGTASKASLSAFIILGIVIAALVIIAALLYWKRKEIAAKIQASKEKRQAAANAQLAAAENAGLDAASAGDNPTPAPGNAANAPTGQVQQLQTPAVQPWSESDLI